jgi:hypothetical protein
MFSAAWLPTDVVMDPALAKRARINLQRFCKLLSGYNIASSRGLHPKFVGCFSDVAFLIVIAQVT